MAESKAQIASLDGMKKRERRKVLKRMTREVMRDKRYRRAIRKNPEPISKKAAQAAADQYLVSVKAATVGLESQLDAVEKRRQTILQEAEEQAAETIRVAQREAKKIVAEAEYIAEEKLAYVEKQAKELLAAHDDLRSLM